MSRVIIIADDLTGALDCAAPFAKWGLATRVVALEGVSAESAARALAEAQVVGINTESRHLTAAAAAGKVTRAVQRYVRAGDVLFKKVDSTLRGNVAAETIAALRASGRSAAAIAPAFPAQGRVTRGGMVYVHGVPLAQTEFVRDALSPAPRESLADVMRAVAPAYTIACLAPGQLRAVDCSRAQLWIVDAQTQVDLDQIIASVRARLSELVLVGSAGLSTALVSALAERGHAPSRSEPAGRPASDGVTLFVVGSRAQKSREQADALRRQPETVCVEAPNGEVSDAVLDSAIASLRVQDNVLLLATQSADSARQSADAVARRLAAACVRLLSRLRPRAIVATGGDTARAILERTRNPIVEVCDEPIPGIALARISVNDDEYLFLTKAGGFGDRDTFTTIKSLLI